jgi:hypothetical protein
MDATVIDLRPMLAAKRAAEGRAWSSEPADLARQMREDMAKLPADHPVCKRAIEHAEEVLRRAAEAGILP